MFVIDLCDAGFTFFEGMCYKIEGDNTGTLAPDNCSDTGSLLSYVGYNQNFVLR